MSNGTKLNELIKQSAIDAVNQTKPSTLVFGTVQSASPLQIKVDDKIVLSTAQLILSRLVTTHKISVTMDWTSESTITDHTHAVDGVTATEDSHTHDISFTSGATGLAHTHEVKGTKSITINNALTVGESVVLLRMQGGQKYLVIDRVVNL